MSGLQWTNVAILPLLAGVLLVLLTPFVWPYRKRPVGIAFLVFLLATSLWTFPYVLELCSVQLPTAVFWANVQYFGIPVAPASIFALTLLLSGVPANRKKVWIGLGIPSVLIWLLIWTDSLHHLVRRQVGLDLSPTGTYYILAFDRGPAYFANLGIAYLLIGLAAIRLVGLTFSRNALTRRQARILLLGLALPFGGNLLNLLGYQLFAGVDQTPILFALSAVVSAYGMFRWSLFSVAPIAREKVVDGLADPVFVLDLQNRPIDVNPAAARIFGIETENISRLTPADLGIPAELLLPGNRKLLEREDRTYVVRHTEIFDEGETPVGSILQLSDITDQRLIQNELMAAKLAAEEASETKSRFVANISHELRTPLNGVIGLSELLESTGLNHEQRKFLGGIQQSSRLLLALISDVLDFSKLDAMSMTISEEVVEIADVVQEVSVAHSMSATAKGIVFHADVEAMPAFILTDGLRIRQIMHNLLSNALKFTAEGSVTVTVKSVGEKEFEIAVVDTGIGIPLEKQDAMFLPFQQAEASTSRNYGGTGLGLAITHGLVERMGGSMTLESEVGVGTTLRVRLPLVESHPVAETEMEEGIPAGLLVLVAEDNEVNTLVVTSMLRRLGCHYDHCVNGREAVDQYCERDYDLVLLDIQMPVMDGLSACREIRARWPKNRTPIFALTANAFEQERQTAIDAGMDGFLTKPIRSRELSDVLRRAAREAGKKRRVHH